MDKNSTSNNPWLDIPSDDYERHMYEVGQTQLLGLLTKEHLDAYHPKSFALLGSATGNGLEFVDPKITSETYAIDINPVFLEKTKTRFEDKIKNLKTIQIDLHAEPLNLKGIDLIFAGLVFEYMEPARALENILPALNKKGILAIVIQRSGGGAFVSKTAYRSLEKLGGFSKEVDEDELTEYLGDKGIRLSGRKELKLNEQKYFVVLTYQRSEV